LWVGGERRTTVSQFVCTDRSPESSRAVMLVRGFVVYGIDVLEVLPPL
jgi:hypothetical protein